MAAALAAGFGIPAMVGTGRPGATAGTSATGAAPAPAFPALDAPFLYSLQGYSLGKLHVSDPIFATATYQEATVTLDGVPKLVEENSAGTWRREYDRPVGILTVYRPGVFRPARFQAGTAVQVHGRPGLLAEFDATVYDVSPAGKGKLNRPGTTTHHTVKAPALAWQYADGAWATIVTNPQYRTADPTGDLLALAGGLAPGEVRAARVPYRFGAVPAGYHLIGVGSFDPTGAVDDISEAYFSKAAVPVTGLTDRVDMETVADSAGGLKIIVAETAPAAPSDPYPHPNPNHPCQPGFCDRAINAGYFAETLLGSGSTSLLRGITDSLVFDDPAAPSTWHPAGDLGTS